ncbi:hypothetical protein ABZX62_04900 [Streptomyces flavidovirens]|uniref:Integral membrane protein n=1 Tax=Streptomyces flavidovirens TaxID=67298 RepID=A0ABW6RIB2_9ACTN
MFVQVHRRVVAHQRKKSDVAIQKLREDAEVLGIGPVPGRLRVALRERYHTAPLFFAAMVPFALVIFWYIASLVNHAAAAMYPDYARRRQAGSPTSSWGWADAIGVVAPLLVVVLAFLCVRRAAAVLGAVFDWKTGTFLRLAVWAELIHQCADIVRAPRIRDQHYGPSVRIAVARVYGARAMRGTVGSTSWRRRKAMRQHAFHVADALRAAEAKLDVQPKEGAREIARLTMKISSRYAEGRVGALLDEGDLAAVAVTGRRFEAAQLAVAVVGATGVALAAPALGLPVQVTVAASVLVVAAVYRNAVFTGLGVLAFLYPLLSPGK